MAQSSNIEWTDATWNPITGCSLDSPGCANCYAMKLAGTRLRNHPSRAGLTTMTKAGPVWNGQVRFNEQWLTQPLTWTKPKMVFVCAHGDLFHEDVPDEWIDRVFAVMALAPQHTFQVLTKRAKRMRRYMAGARDRIVSITEDGNEYVSVRTATAYHSTTHVGGKVAWPLPNVWLGVSTEDQRRADQRIPELLATPAAVRFLSAEPLLGPIDLKAAWYGENALDSECWGDCAWCDKGYPPLHNCQRGRGDWKKERSGLDWVIVGGESGPRPAHPDWARSLRDQCDEAGVPFFFKQWGSWLEFYDRDRDDPEWRNIPGTDGQSGRGATRWVNLAGGHGFHGERLVAMRNVGKKAAGRLLDGVEHNGFPNTRRSA